MKASGSASTSAWNTRSEPLTGTNRTTYQFEVLHRPPRHHPKTNAMSKGRYGPATATPDRPNLHLSFLCFVDGVLCEYRSRCRSPSVSQIACSSLWAACQPQQLFTKCSPSVHRVVVPLSGSVSLSQCSPPHRRARS
jgi:hypothetical protein